MEQHQMSASEITAMNTEQPEQLSPFMFETPWGVRHVVVGDEGCREAIWQLLGERKVLLGEIKNLQKRRG